MRRPDHALRRGLVRSRNRLRARLPAWLASRARRMHRTATLPLAVLFLFLRRDLDPAYGMTWVRRLRLALRMHRNSRAALTGTSYKAHLAMAVKLLEIPPDVEGDVVECGCFQGGSTANLSLMCEIVGRRLVVYDSFEGLPAAQPGDRYASDAYEGQLSAGLEEVRATVSRLGSVGQCEFRKGWFEDTLPEHDTPIVLCFLDVDYQASLRDCVVNLWPHLTERGYVFIDEYVLLDYCALFFSERFWRETFDRVPPGLIGAGAGVGVGEHYLGPWEEQRFQGPGSIAYTRKDFTGSWEYFPGDGVVSQRSSDP
jgi:O-methyltransferase